MDDAYGDHLLWVLPEEELHISVPYNRGENAYSCRCEESSRHVRWEVSSTASGKQDAANKRWNGFCCVLVMPGSSPAKI